MINRETLETIAQQSGYVVVVAGFTCDNKILLGIPTSNPVVAVLSMNNTAGHMAQNDEQIMAYLDLMGRAEYVNGHICWPSIVWKDPNQPDDGEEF